MQSAVLCLENMDCLIAEADKHAAELKSLLEAAKTFSRLTFLFGTRHWQPPSFMYDCLYLSVAVPVPDLATCKRLWEEGLAASDRFSPDIDSAVLAGKFRFGLSQIKDALAAATNLAQWRSPGEWQITVSDLYAACRTQSSPKLGAVIQEEEGDDAVSVVRDSAGQPIEIWVRWHEVQDFYASDSRVAGD